MFLGMIFFLLITSLIPEPDMSSLYSTENEQDAQSIDEKRIFPLDEYYWIEKRMNLRMMTTGLFAVIGIRYSIELRIMD